MSRSSGDLFSVLAVNAFGAAGVATSLFDFFVAQRHSIFELNPLGVLVFLVGIALVVSARRTLGRYFTTRVSIAREQKLIQSGPYKYIRHPIYLGILLEYFAAPIAWPSPFGALVTLPIILVLLRRIGLEEKAMRSHFDTEYEAYAGRTKKLVPFVY